jgi:hypothetical protein
VPPALIEHSKGTKQFLLEQNAIAESSKLNGKSGTADRKERKAAKQAVGIGEARGGGRHGHLHAPHAHARHGVVHREAGDIGVVLFA